MNGQPFNLSVISAEEMKNLIQQSEERLFQRLSQSFAPKEQEEYISREKAAEVLGITLPTLLSYTKSGRVKGYKIGNRVRYKRKEVESALKQIRPI